MGNIGGLLAELRVKAKDCGGEEEFLKFVLRTSRESYSVIRYCLLPSSSLEFQGSTSWRYILEQMNEHPKSYNGVDFYFNVTLRE